MISDISIVSIILTILLVGVSLAGLILAVQRMMHKMLDDLRKEMNDMRKEQAESREQVAGRLGKVEGLLEGLREFLTSRRAA